MKLKAGILALALSPLCSAQVDDVPIPLIVNIVAASEACPTLWPDAIDIAVSEISQSGNSLEVLQEDDVKGLAPKTEVVTLNLVDNDQQGQCQTIVEAGHSIRGEIIAADGLLIAYLGDTASSYNVVAFEAFDVPAAGSYLVVELERFRNLVQARRATNRPIGN
ncbi:MAG: hypothetical protein AAF950_07140 [Pseudomonadota bacterium]